MTLLHSHDFQLRGSAGITLRRAIKRIGATFRTIHTALAAARLRRLRNELMLHYRHEDWTQLDVRTERQGEDAARYPRQPLVLGEKWDD